MKKISILALLFISLVGCYKTEKNTELTSNDENEYTIKFIYFEDDKDSTKILDKKVEVEKKVKFGTSLTSDLQPANMKRTGFKLKAWKDNVSINQIVFDGKLTVKKDMILYGVWEYVGITTTEISYLEGLGKLEVVDIAKGKTIFGVKSGSSGNGSCATCHARPIFGIFADQTAFESSVKANKDSFISMAKQGHNNNFNLQQILHVEAYLNSL